MQHITRRASLCSVVCAAALTALTTNMTMAASLAERMRATEERVAVKADSFKGCKFYESTLTEYIETASDFFYPYISYRLEDGDRFLFGYIRTESSDWIMLNGVIVLVGEKRYAYYPAPLEALAMRGSDCASSYDGLRCTEWFNLPAKKGEELFKMFTAIADAPDSVPVKVRAAGSDGNSDWELNKDERQAWKDIVFYYLNFSQRTK